MGWSNRCLFGVSRFLFPVLLLVTVVCPLPRHLAAADEKRAMAAEEAKAAVLKAEEDTERAKLNAAEFKASSAKVDADAAKSAADNEKDKQKKAAASKIAAERNQEALEAETAAAEARESLAKIVAKHAVNAAKAAAPAVAASGVAAPSGIVDPASAAAASAATSVDIAENVHVIIAAHTRSDLVFPPGRTNGISLGARSNATMIENLLVNQAMGKARVNRLIDNNFDHQTILTTIRSLPMGSRGTDTIFLYIGCHGGTDQTGQHALQVFNVPGRPDGLIVRTAYLNAMRRKGARQIVMVTDTCSNRLAVTLPPPTAAFVAAAAIPKQTNLLAALLLYQSGVYDIGGSRPPRPGDNGEFGAYLPNGGMFTRAFYNAAVYCPDASEGWHSLFKNTSDRLPQGPITFDDGTVQQGQHPFAFPTR